MRHGQSAHLGKYWVDLKVHLDFSIRAGKTQKNFLSNSVHRLKLQHSLQLKKKKNVKCLNETDQINYDISTLRWIHGREGEQAG